MIRKLILPLMAALALSGCAGLGALMSGQAPAPLARTVVDDRVLNATAEAFDIALDLVESRIDQPGPLGIQSGSPQARQLAAAIREVQRWLNVGRAAVEAGNATQLSEAITHVRQAFTRFRAGAGLPANLGDVQ